LIFSKSDLVKCLVAGVVGACVGSGVTYAIMKHKAKKQQEILNDTDGKGYYTYEEFMSKSEKCSGKKDESEESLEACKDTDGDDGIMSLPIPKVSDDGYYHYSKKYLLSEMSSLHPVDSDEDDGSDDIDVSPEEIAEGHEILDGDPFGAPSDEDIALMIAQKKAVDSVDIVKDCSGNAGDNPLMDEPDKALGELSDVESEDGEEPLFLEPVEVDIDPNEPPSYIGRRTFWQNEPGYEIREWNWYTKDDTVCMSDEMELIDNWKDFMPDDIEEHKGANWLYVRDPKHAVKIVIRCINGGYDTYLKDLED